MSEDLAKLVKRHERAAKAGYARCRHFTGLQHKTCEAGIAYDSVRDADEGPAEWPCLRVIGSRPAATECPKRSLLTPEELAAEEVELNRAFDAAMAGNCPQCGAAMQKREGEGTAVWSCPTHGFVRRDCGVKKGR